MGQDIICWLTATRAGVCNLHRMTPALEVSLLLPPASPALGPVPGCSETGDNLAALCGPFLRAGIRAWLLVLVHGPDCCSTTPVGRHWGNVLHFWFPSQEAFPWAETWNLSGWAQHFILHHPFPSAEDIRICRVVSSPGSTPCACRYRHIMKIRVHIQFAEDEPVSLNWNIFQLPHWQLPLPTPFPEKERTKRKRRPHSAAAECSGQPEENIYSCYVCAHTSWAVLGLGGFACAGKGSVKASTVLCQQLRLARGNRHPVPQTSCRRRGGCESKATVLAICHLKSSVVHLYKYICAAGYPSAAR